INNIKNVLGTALVYHQIETDLDETDLETGSNNSQLEGEV
ncbi:nitrate reductase, partial [Vibrio lentus]